MFELSTWAERTCRLEVPELDVHIASRNPHKLAEFAALLAPYSITVRGLSDAIPVSPETGETFEANAVQKAMFYGKWVDGWVLADDSGICVDALHGAPGVYSARFAGAHGDDAANNQKLLGLLAETPVAERTAQFVCAVAAWRRDSAHPIVAVGEVAGRVDATVRGASGFGYDGLFYVPNLDRTFAELSFEEKNRISHRAQAVRRLMDMWEVPADAPLSGQ